MVNKLKTWLDIEHLNTKTGDCLSIELTQMQIAHIESLLTEECIESMRGVDDAVMRDRTGG